MQTLADSIVFRPTSYGWVDWTAFAFTVIGTIFTLAGIALTYREARTSKLRAGEAKSAAEAAKEAAAAAVETVTDRMTIADLGELRRALTSIVDTLEAAKLD